MAHFARYEVLCEEVSCYGLSARTKVEKDINVDRGRGLTDYVDWMNAKSCPKSFLGSSLGMRLNVVDIRSSCLCLWYILKKIAFNS